MADFDILSVPRDDLGEEVSRMLERFFFQRSIPMPDGYTHVGAAMSSDGGLKLFVTGEGVPAMAWDLHKGEGGWTRIIPADPDA